VSGYQFNSSNRLEFSADVALNGAPLTAPGRSGQHS